MRGPAGISGTGVSVLMLLAGLNGCAHAPEKARPQKHTIEIAQMKFVPAELKVPEGDTVVFVNHDMVAHDITDDPGKTWASSPLNEGQSWFLVVTKSSHYYCTFHPVMKGKIIMQ